MIGRRLSHYEVVADLGAGGMGVVYRAHDTRLDRDVAIKVLPTDRPFSETARRRFQREAMAASALNHPNIITIYEINSEDNIDFIVMEYVRGVTLSSVLKKRSLGMEEAIRYCIQIADALTKAHAAGIIHRDLKPGNIMITEDGLVKVLDFGLAKFDASMAPGDKPTDNPETNEMTLTQPGIVTGTVAYMSPEQARGERVDARSDIFSFGTVMFEMLSGQLPFIGPNSIALLHNLHFSPPRDLSELRPEVPPVLVSLVGGMLEKSPEKRIQTIAEVAAGLRRVAGGSTIGPVTWHPSDATMELAHPTPALSKRRINQVGTWATAAGLLLVLTVGGWAGWRFYKRAKLGQAPVADLPADTNAYALYQRARELLDHFDQEGNVDQAIALLGRAMQINPQSAAASAALSEAYFFKNRPNPDPQWMKQASEYANRAVGLDDQLAEAHISLGLVKMQSSDSAGAEKEFRAAADLDPKSSRPHRFLAELYNTTGKGDAAVQEAKHALQLDPADWGSYMELGLSGYQVANYQAAADNWEKALKLEPNNAPALRNLGAAYHGLNRDDDAAAALQRALEIKPNSSVYNNLGTIRFYQGRYQDAVPAFEKGIALGANNSEMWGSLADAYRWAPGHSEKAKGAYQTAIRMVREEISKNPGQPELHSSLALYLAKSGDKAGALQEVKQVEQLQSKDPVILYETAVVYELGGNRDQALASLLASVKAGEELNDIRNDPELVSLRADPRYHLEIESAAVAKSSP
jgi:tetratricopeptide (TPR) repeat protein/predicted Ser/Thr protein kinase